MVASEHGYYSLLMEPAPYEHITVRRLSPNVGAELSGQGSNDLDLTNLDDATFDEIHRAFLESGAIFFRDQELSPEQQVAFAARFGPPEIYPFKDKNPNFSPHPSGMDEIVRLEHDEDRPGFENAWHTDVSWMVEPSLGSVLYAVELPPSGGDTLFACGQALYESLDPSFRSWLDKLAAEHDWLNVFGRKLDPDQLAHYRRKHPGAMHPLVRTHPETGKKGLYFSVFLVHILGLDSVQSKELHNHLITLISRPEFQCRWNWEVGSVAVWDNRRVQHYAVNDYYPQRRVMDRVTIAGDKPF